MKPDLEYLRRHYASLSDEALRAIDRTELVDAARQCYDEEIQQRKAVVRQGAGTEAPAGVSRHHSEDRGDDGAKPNWLEEGACVGIFVARSGNEAGVEAEEARRILAAAQIPCFVGIEEIAPEKVSPERQFEYRVMVPGGLNLEAISVMDKEIYNPKLEADWRAHLEELSDEEFRGVNPEVICAGMQDRVERLRKAYEDEVERRRLRAESGR